MKTVTREQEDHQPCPTRRPLPPFGRLPRPIRMPLPNLRNLTRRGCIQPPGWNRKNDLRLSRERLFKPWLIIEARSVTAGNPTFNPKPRTRTRREKETKAAARDPSTYVLSDWPVSRRPGKRRRRRTSRPPRSTAPAPLRVGFREAGGCGDERSPINRCGTDAKAHRLTGRSEMRVLGLAFAVVLAVTVSIVAQVDGRRSDAVSIR
jgi:hypothetical protein